MYLGAPWWPLLGRDSALRHHILYERKIYALHIGMEDGINANERSKACLNKGKLTST